MPSGFSAIHSQVLSHVLDYLLAPGSGCLAHGTGPGLPPVLLQRLFRRGGAWLGGTLALPRGLFRERSWALAPPAVHSVVPSFDGSYRLLMPLEDGALVEGVGLPGVNGLTTCLSVQTGCSVGCRFCHTARQGGGRSLSPGEMVALLGALCLEAGTDHPHSVVFMGMGEPMLNLDAVLVTLDLLASHHGLALPARRLTVSTVGMRGMAEAFGATPYGLTLSLHSPFPEQRRWLMPHPQVLCGQELDAELRACVRARGGRGPMLAYLLLGGVNDSLDHARALAGLARPHRCRVNLLPLHGGEGLPFVPSSEADTASFYKFLQGEGVRVFFRKSRGQDVGGACGQLVGRARDCDSGKGGVG